MEEATNNEIDLDGEKKAAYATISPVCSTLCYNFMQEDATFQIVSH